MRFPPVRHAGYTQRMDAGKRKGDTACRIAPNNYFQTFTYAYYHKMRQKSRLYIRPLLCD